MALKTFGMMGVDWEERVDFERLRTQRLARIKRCSKSRNSARCFALT